MITLRQTQYEDYILLADTGYGAMGESEFCKMADASMLKELDDKYFQSFTIVDNDAVVGIATLFAHSRHIIGTGIEIRPPHRQRGYATYVLKKLLEFAKSLGYAIASTYVREDNVPSKAFHEKLGFEKDGVFEKNGREVCVYLKLL